MVFNGDLDMACNHLGDMWFVEDLDQPVILIFLPQIKTNCSVLSVLLRSGMSCKVVEMCTLYFSAVGRVQTVDVHVGV